MIKAVFFDLYQTLGLVSNIERDIAPLLDEVGLAPLLQVVVTSLETGFNKPQPEIFQVALERAGAQALEAIYVGDQYQVDIVGARQAGMTGILLDRGGYLARITDCPRIRSLTEVTKHL